MWSPNGRGSHARSRCRCRATARRLLLAGIFGLLLIYSLYFARDMAIPVVFAVILHFALEPVMRSLVRLHIPRVLAGLLVILAFLACVAGFAMTLSAPAADWIAKAPQSLSRIEDRLYFLKEQIARVQDTLHQVEKIAAGTGQGNRGGGRGGTGSVELSLHRYPQHVDGARHHHGAAVLLPRLRRHDAAPLRRDPAAACRQEAGRGDHPRDREPGLRLSRHDRTDQRRRSASRRVWPPISAACPIRFSGGPLPSRSISFPSWVRSPASPCCSWSA